MHADVGAFRSRGRGANGGHLRVLGDVERVRNDQTIPNTLERREGTQETLKIIERQHTPW